MRVVLLVGLIVQLLGLTHSLPQTADAQTSVLVPAKLEIHGHLQNLPPLEVPRTVNLPAGFRISVFAAGLRSPRQIAFSPSGVLFSADLQPGEVAAHPDSDGNGVSEPFERVVFASGLWAPHSLWFDGSDLYVGAHDGVLRYTDADANLVPDGPGVTLVSLPTYGAHITRTVLVGADRKLYVGVGSTTNAEIEPDQRRGTVMRYELDGSGEHIFARGLRNPVGLVIHPVTDAIWASDIGVDDLGEERPLEEINILHPEGHYGWPYCYEAGVLDVRHSRAVAPSFCSGTIPPVATLRAHTTPLGISFYSGTQFPTEYQQRLFVALRGSSHRQDVQAGYSLVSLEIGPDGANPVVEEFATGWLLDPRKKPGEAGQSWGRPVQPITGPDGSLYLSSDTPGAIYRIWWEP